MQPAYQDGDRSERVALSGSDVRDLNEEKNDRAAIYGRDGSGEICLTKPGRPRRLGKTLADCIRSDTAVRASEIQLTHFGRNEPVSQSSFGMGQHQIFVDVEGMRTARRFMFEEVKEMRDQFAVFI